MTKTSRGGQRKQQILQALAKLLEANPGHRITTARLADEVGVSEAALYRHFPSKHKMFEALIDFIEEALFSRINRILEAEKRTLSRCETMAMLILKFAEMNPGMSRILTGDALSGENDALRHRIARMFDRLEVQFLQVLREAGVRGEGKCRIDERLAANAIISMVEGRISQFVRSEFEHSPSENWPQQWQLLGFSLLDPSVSP